MVQFSSGSILGRYELLVPVARGGMAEVWAARLHGTRGFTKLVAVKTIRGGAMDDSRLEQMLLAEAELAARIQHPNVVSTLELGEQDDALFLVMEWADAEPLSYIVSEIEVQVPLKIGVGIIAQACAGLHRAHELRDDNGELLGVVHRDVSPQNVLVTYHGVVKVVDFGIAKATQRSSSMTEDGEVKGKLAYMAPEQVRGAKVDRRTDVFALGTILYLMTTGQHPYKGSHPGETLAKLCSATPFIPPSRIVEGYPPELEAVVVKAMRKEPDQRYADADEMRVALYAAMPDAKGIEGEIAQFLAKVSDGRGEKRRRHIRAAGELLDMGQVPSLPGQSSTSLSAMSVVKTGSHSSRSFARLSQTQAVAEMHRPRFSPKVLVGAGAAALAIGGLVLSQWQGPVEPNPRTFGAAAAGEGLPLQSQAAPQLPTQDNSAPLLNAEEEKEPPSTAKDADDDSSEEAEQKEDEVAKDRKLSAATRQQLVKRNVAKPVVRTAPVKPAPPPATADAPTSAPVTDDIAREAPRAAPSAPKRAGSDKQKKVDSWDPETFGGRL